MNGMWFRKLLFSYLPIVVILIFSLSSIFFVLVNRSLEDQARRANEVFIEQVLNQLDLTLGLIDQQLIKEINYNEILLNYYYSRSESPFDKLVEPADRLQEILGSLSMVDSIYMYRSDDQTVLSNNALMPLERFGDREFILHIQDEDPSLRWTPVRDYIEFEGLPAKGVISLVRNVPILTGEEGFIVININRQTIASYIKDMTVSNINYIRLMDQSGGNIYAPADTESGTTISTAQSDYTGWTIHSGIRDGGLFTIFSNLHWIWLIIIALALASTIAWLVFVTRQNYKPVEMIVEQVRNYAMQRRQVFSSSKEADEFSFIQNALFRLIEQSNEHQLQHAESLLYRRQYFFQ